MKAPPDLMSFIDLYWSNAIVGLAVVDMDGRIKYANPLFCSIVEYTEAELQEKNFRDITHLDDVKYDSIMLDRIKRGEVPSYLMKKRYITKTGRVIWVKLRVDSGYNQQGELEIFIAQVGLVDIPPNEIKIPGEDKISKYESEARRRIIKWIIGIAAGVSLLITGAFVDSTTSATLITIGSTLILGSGGAAVAESRDVTTAVGSKKK